MLFLGSIIEEITTSSVKHIATNLFRKYKLAKLTKSLNQMQQDALIARYQNENDHLFNSLDSFLCNIHAFRSMCENCYDMQNSLFSSPQAYINTITQDFVELNPQFQVNKADIISFLSKLFNQLFSILNNSKYNSDRNIIVNNIIASKNEILENQTQSSKKIIAEIQNSSQKIIDSFKKSYFYSKAESIDDIPQANKSKYYEEIKSIEDNLQKKYLFEKSIEAYEELSLNILSDNYSSGTLPEKEVLQSIYINIALCFANLRKFEKSEGYMQKAKSLDVDESAKFHYIAASIILMQSDISKFHIGLSHIQKAIEIDSKYQKAYLSKAVFEEALKLTSTTQILNELSEGFKQILHDGNDLDLINEYHQTLGIIFLHSSQYKCAIEQFEFANKISLDITNHINIAISYYKWALVGNDFSRRQIKPIVDYQKLNTSIELFLKIFDNYKINENPILNDVIPIYISACAFGHRYDYIISLDNKLNLSNLDYETQRNIYFSKMIMGKNSDNAETKLDKIDSVFHNVNILMGQNKFSDAILLLENSYKFIPSEYLERYYTQFLNCFLLSKQTDKYRIKRNYILNNNINLSYLALFDAQYYDLTGDYDKSKKIFDKISRNTHDDIEIIDSIAFYKRHDNIDELKLLYSRINKEIKEKSVPVNNIKQFYFNLFRDLENTDILYCIKIYENLAIDLFKGEENYYYRQGADLYSKINDSYKLINVFNELIKIDNDKHFKYYLIQVNMDCCNFKQAKELALTLLRDSTNTNSDKTKLYSILGELFLYENDLDKSFELIKKAKDLNIKEPYNPIHQQFMAHAVRCNHIEALSESFEYKKIHPNVVNWLTAVKAIEIDNSGKEVLTPDIKKFLSDNQERFKLVIDYYNGNQLSLYQIIDVMPTTICTFLNWADIYKFPIKINFGNVIDLNNELNILKNNNEVIIDALTLIYLAKYNALDLLKFDKIHITTSSVTLIRSEFVNRNEKYLSDLLQFLSTDLRISFEPCISSSEKFDLHYPICVYDSIEFAKVYNLPCFYSDMLIKLHFQKYEVKFVNIVALADYIIAQNRKASISFRYNMLQANYQFINFRAEDIYDVVTSCTEKSNLNNIIKPFLCLKSQYDVISFANVYSNFIGLIKDNAPSLLNECIQIFLKYVDKIYLKKSNYDYYYTRFSSINDLGVSTRLLLFVKFFLGRLSKLLGKDELKNYIAESNLKYIPEQIIEEIV